jgi:hypothetical protein
MKSESSVTACSLEGRVIEVRYERFLATGQCLVEVCIPLWEFVGRVSVRVSHLRIFYIGGIRVSLVVCRVSHGATFLCFDSVFEELSSRLRL